MHTAIRTAAIIAITLLVREAIAGHNSLTPSMIRMALMRNNVSISPGSRLQLQDERGNQHDFRLESFDVRVRDGTFTIIGQTTQLN